MENLIKITDASGCFTKINEHMRGGLKDGSNSTSYYHFKSPLLLHMDTIFYRCKIKTVFEKNASHLVTMRTIVKLPGLPNGATMDIKDSPEYYSTLEWLDKNVKLTREFNKEADMHVEIYYESDFRVVYTSQFESYELCFNFSREYAMPCFYKYEDLDNKDRDSHFSWDSLISDNK